MNLVCFLRCGRLGVIPSTHVMFGSDVSSQGGQLVSAFSRVCTMRSCIRDIQCLRSKYRKNRTEQLSSRHPMRHSRDLKGKVKFVGCASSCFSSTTSNLMATYHPYHPPMCPADPSGVYAFMARIDARLDRIENRMKSTDIILGYLVSRV